MRVENAILGIKSSEVVNEMKINNGVSLTGKYSELVGMVEDRKGVSNNEFVSFINNEYARYLDANQGVLGKLGLVDKQMHVNNIFDLVTVNIPRQIAFSDKFGVTIKDTCLLENALFFASKQLESREKREYAESIGSKEVDNFEIDEIGYEVIFLNNYKKLCDVAGKKDMFDKYVDFAQQFSNERSANLDLSITERLCNKNAINVCGQALQNIHAMEVCEGFASIDE